MFQIDKQVRTCAKLLEDTELLAKLCAGDMGVLEDISGVVSVCKENKV